LGFLLEHLVSERFYCPDPPLGERYRLVGDEAKHLVRVSRHGVGDCVELFDGKGYSTTARVVEVSKGEVALAAHGMPVRDPDPTRFLTLASAVPKGDRFDWLVEKATELGVARLIPLVTERAIVHPREAKLVRLRKTVVEASKQSGRSRLMVLESPRPWSEVRGSHANGVRLLATPQGKPRKLWPRLVFGQELIVAVGPEGGFSPAEERMALEAGWVAIRLGEHILRIETAGVAAAAILLAGTEEQDRDAMG
jgi:16S rRNA (uracil1498-N3)-methyltransferase